MNTGTYVDFLRTEIEIRAATGESVRRTHDISPLCSIHRTKHTHTHTRVHTSRSQRRYFPGSRISRTQQSRALPDSCVDDGPRTVDIHPWRSRVPAQFTASADLLAPRRQSDRLCISVVRHPTHSQYTPRVPREPHNIINIVFRLVSADIDGASKFFFCNYFDSFRFFSPQIFPTLRNFFSIIHQIHEYTTHHYQHGSPSNTCCSQCRTLGTCASTFQFVIFAKMTSTNCLPNMVQAITVLTVLKMLTNGML